MKSSEIIRGIVVLDVATGLSSTILPAQGAWKRIKR
jgi:hypothetical protein